MWFHLSTFRINNTLNVHENSIHQCAPVALHLLFSRGILILYMLLFTWTAIFLRFMQALRSFSILAAASAPYSSSGSLENILDQTLGASTMHRARIVGEYTLVSVYISS